MSLFMTAREEAALKNAANDKYREENRHKETLLKIEESNRKLENKKIELELKLVQEKTAQINAETNQQKEKNRHEEALIKLEIERLKAENKAKELMLKEKAQEKKIEKQYTFNNFSSDGCTLDEQMALQKRIMDALKGE